MTQQASSEKRLLPARSIAVVEYTAFVYGVLASVATVVFAIVTINSAISGGGNAMSLVVGASPASVFAPLASDPGGAVDSYFSEVTFSAVGLSPGASLLYYAPRAIAPLTQAIIAFSIMAIAAAARTSRPFGPALSRATAISALAIALLGTASQLSLSFGRGFARSELLAGTGLVRGWGSDPTFDWTPVLVGVALALVAAIFRRGERLQRDTEGLV